MIDRTSNLNIIRNIDNKKNQPAFKGGTTAVLTGLRGLNNKPALGACAVDLASMVIPRTLIEFKNRGKQAGMEAGIREGSSCFIHACVGLIGLGAAALVSKNFNSQFGVKAQNIFASGNTVKNMASLWEKAEGNTDKFFKQFLKNLKGLNGNKWNEISSGAAQEITNNLVKLSEKTGELSLAKGVDKANLAKEIKNLKGSVAAQITKNTGAQSSFILNEVKDESGKIVSKGISSNINELIDNAVSLSNAFKGKTKEEFPEFIKALTKNKKISTIAGLSFCAALCMSIQPVNRYLTKKRTGQDGFVGVENREPDNSKGFKALKTALGLGFPAFAISTIGKPADLLSNVQFNSKIPAINQFKLLYGLTIGSRFMAARDKNELRESFIKDTLGFTNWLILGGMVSKLTARAIGGKELINNPLNQRGKKGIKYAAEWLTKSSVKTFDEVLIPKSNEFIKDGKLMKFSQLFKNASSNTKSKILKIGCSQVAGYLYSGIVLGMGISKLNIFITKQLEAKKNANDSMKQETLSYSGIKNNMIESNSVFKDFS